MIINDVSQFVETIKQIRGRILAIDFGMKKNGLAMSDKERMIASPFKVVETKNLRKEIENLVREYEIKVIVIGKNLGKYNLNEEIDKLASSLDHPDLIIGFFDESLTSKLADRFLREVGYKREVRNKIDDKIAACILLQDLLALL